MSFESNLAGPDATTGDQPVQNNAQSTKKPGGVTGKGFMPGESGNPGGRPKKTPVTDLFRDLLDGEYEQRRDEIRAVFSGKSAMAKVLLLRDAAERLEGKIAQNVHVDGELTISLSERMAKARERVSE